jgi:CRP-like cAMP-binding protein
MEKLFGEISAITSVQGLFLLSLQGEVLFETGWRTAGDGFERIKNTIRSIGGTNSARFSFDNGKFYLHKTEIGYLLVGMGHTASDALVKDGCAAVTLKLGEPESRKGVLLHALTDSRQDFKPQIIKALVPYGDAEVARGLVRLLAEERNFDSEIHDRLLLYICKALGYCPSKEGLKSLRDLLKNNMDLKDDVRKVASVAIQQIETNLPAETADPAQQEFVGQISGSQEDISGNENGGGMQITGLAEELKIRELLSQGEKEKGRQLLKDIIVRSAKSRRFEEAEKLREWLIEIDPMGLGDIIKTAEIIEDEKNASIDKGHQAVWSALSDVLDPNEFSTLYHALEHKKYPSGEIVVKQGALQSVLYFVNSGRIELFFQEKGKDVPVNTIGPGEILGAATFFESSVWTFNARSLGAEVALLRLDKVQQWQKNYPSLESNLNDFCLRFKFPHESFRRMGRDRRVFERVHITGRVSMSLLDKNGSETGIGAKGDLFDISTGGVAFFLRVSQKKNARLLFGRRVKVTMASAVSSVFTTAGIILAVRSQPVVGNEYSVHVRFSRVLEPDELKGIVAGNTEQP